MLLVFIWAFPNLLELTLTLYCGLEVVSFLAGCAGSANTNAFVLLNRVFQLYLEGVDKAVDIALAF